MSKQISRRVEPFAPLFAAGKSSDAQIAISELHSLHIT